MIKKNKLPKYELTKMNTENTIQVKTSQTQKNTHLFGLIYINYNFIIIYNYKTILLVFLI